MGGRLSDLENWTESDTTADSLSVDATPWLSLFSLSPLPLLVFASGCVAKGVQSKSVIDRPARESERASLTAVRQRYVTFQRSSFLLRVVHLHFSHRVLPRFSLMGAH